VITYERELLLTHPNAMLAEWNKEEKGGAAGRERWARPKSAASGRNTSRSKSTFRGLRMPSGVLDNELSKDKVCVCVCVFRLLLLLLSSSSLGGRGFLFCINH
jgi:hypothetical protein